MPKASKDSRWQTADNLEDLLSIIGTIYKATEVILDHAHHHDPLNTEASFDQIWNEASDIQEDLQLLQKMLSRRWAKIVTSIDGQQVIKTGDKVLSFEDAKRAS